MLLFLKIVGCPFGGGRYNGCPVFQEGKYRPLFLFFTSLFLPFRVLLVLLYSYRFQHWLLVTQCGSGDSNQIR